MSIVVGVSTAAGIPAVEGVPSAVVRSDVPIFSDAVHQAVTDVSVVRSCCLLVSLLKVAGFSTFADFLTA